MTRRSPALGPADFSLAPPLGALLCPVLMNNRVSVSSEPFHPLRVLVFCPPAELFWRWAFLHFIPFFTCIHSLILIRQAVSTYYNLTEGRRRSVGAHWRLDKLPTIASAVRGVSRRCEGARSRSVSRASVWRTVRKSLDCLRNSLRMLGALHSSWSSCTACSNKPGANATEGRRRAVGGRLRVVDELSTGACALREVIRRCEGARSRSVSRASVW